jgi:hypothetical protein
LNKPSAEQFEIAGRLLSHESSGELGVEAIAEAAGRLHQKLFARLASLLGVGGARALLARSVKSASIDYVTLRGIDLDDEREAPAELLAARLRAEEPTTAAAAATHVCAQMLALLTTLIGERLTRQLLLTAWPTFDPSATPRKETR